MIVFCDLVFLFRYELLERKNKLKWRQAAKLILKRVCPNILNTENFQDAVRICEESNVKEAFEQICCLSMEILIDEIVEFGSPKPESFYYSVEKTAHSILNLDQLRSKSKLIQLSLYRIKDFLVEIYGLDVSYMLIHSCWI